MFDYQNKIACKNLSIIDKWKNVQQIRKEFYILIFDQEIQNQFKIILKKQTTKFRFIKIDSLLQQTPNTIMPKHHQKQYIDIPFLMEQSPAQLQQKLISYDMPQNPDELIKDFLDKLQKTIKNQQPTQTQSFNIYCLYHNYFDKIDQRSKFPYGFPKPNIIQEKYQIQYNLSVLTLYNELIYRSRFDKLKDSDMVKDFLLCVEESWENYQSIFQHQSTKIDFHPIVAWDLFQAFLHQLSQFNFRMESLPKDKIDANIFSLKGTKVLLGRLIEKIPKQFKGTPNTQELFGYYALLTLAIVQVYQGNYQKALDLLSRLSLESLLIYSKSFGSLISLFLTVSYSHFMLQQYHKSARLGQMILMFYLRNKKYLSSIQWLVNRQFQKLAGLLCISYIFLEQQPKNIIMDIFKNTSLKFKDKRQKQRLLDKYFKLKQNDQQTFTKLFNHCCLPVLGSNRTLQQHHKLILGRFQKLQSITLNSILRHYTQISIKKVSLMLKVPEQQLKQQLSQYNSVKAGQNSWDLTVMNPLLSQRKIINIQITQNDIVRLNEFDNKGIQQMDQEEWKQYRDQVSWLAEKVEAI